MGEGRRRETRLELVEQDLVEAIWEDRPERSAEPVRSLDFAYSGEAPSASGSPALRPSGVAFTTAPDGKLAEMEEVPA